MQHSTRHRNLRLRLWRYVWAAPASLAGLLLGLLAVVGGARLRLHHGVLEVAGGRIAPALLLQPLGTSFIAVTLGHVIIACNACAMAGCRAHEHVHVRQYERWGVFFFPLYLGSSIWQLLRGGHPYLDNHFEREARALAAEIARELP